MQPDMDMRLTELMCSRLCHDLISPIMAVNNGMELLEEETSEVSADVRELLATSADAAVFTIQATTTSLWSGSSSEDSPLWNTVSPRISRRQLIRSRE